MDSSITFTITLLGIFVIFELLKSNQNFSLLRLVILARLILLTSGSFLDYLFINGYEIPNYKEIYKAIAIILFIHMLFLIVLKKVPKLIIGLETFFTLYFILQTIYGFQIPFVTNGILQNKYNLSEKLFYGLTAFFILSTFFYILIQLNKKSNNNIYEKKIKKWVNSIIISTMVVFFINTIVLIFIKKEIIPFFNNTRMEVNIIRIIFLLFVLFRPKFLDDDKYAIPFNKLITRNKEFTYHNFEFVFYSHYYYLRQDANLDDLALMLNTSKNELSNFLNNEMKQNFTELLNKNRVIYFENLLLDKKFESFTIEALSEMSGFNNRRTMYNAFKKHIGMTPSEYLLRFK